MLSKTASSEQSFTTVFHPAFGVKAYSVPVDGQGLDVPRATFRDQPFQSSQTLRVRRMRGKQRRHVDLLLGQNREKGLQSTGRQSRALEQRYTLCVSLALLIAAE